MIQTKTPTMAWQALKSAVCLMLILLSVAGCYGNSWTAPLSIRAQVIPEAMDFLSQTVQLSSRLTSVDDVSVACLQDLQRLSTQDEVDVIRVLDSFGKPLPGLLEGNTAWLGHYDECMDMANFTHCLVDLGVNASLTANTTVPLTINWGVCVPTSCSPRDVQDGLELLLDILNVSWIRTKDDVYGSAVHCTEKPTTFSAGFIATSVFIGVLCLLSVLGTVVDKYLACQRRHAELPDLPDIAPSRRAVWDHHHHSSASNEYATVDRRLDAAVKQEPESPSSLYATVDKSRNRQKGDSAGEQGGGAGARGVNSSPYPNSNPNPTGYDDSDLYACVDDLRAATANGVSGQRSENTSHCHGNDGGYGATNQKFGGSPPYDQTDTRETNHSAGASESTSLLGGKEKNRVPRTTCSSHPLWMRLLLCFAISRNLPKILSTKQAEGGIPCLNGIRVISISWVILGHSMVMVLNSGLSENLLSAGRRFITSFTFQVMTSTVLAVDTFFLLSGLLLSYLCLKRMKERNGQLPWGWFYLHRYIRLTPALAMLILVWMFILPAMDQGPVWYRLQTFMDNCRNWWWSDLLYINNFVPPALRQDCISWAWYLANDMQFFIISPLLIIPLYWYPRLGLASVGVVGVGSFITTGVLVYQHEFSIGFTGDVAGAAVPEAAPGNYLAANDYMSVIYTKPYCRIPPYLLGIAMGYALYSLGRRRPRLSPVLVAAGWAVATALGMAVVYGLYNVQRGVSVPSQAASVMYRTFSSFTWTLAVSWVIFACHYGYGGVINDILSWDFWVPLSRLTYSTYLLHPVIQTLYGFGLAVPVHWSIVTLSHLFAAFLLLAHCCALVMAILVEFPFGNLEKMLQGNGYK